MQRACRKCGSAMLVERAGKLARFTCSNPACRWKYEKFYVRKGTG